MITNEEQRKALHILLDSMLDRDQFVSKLADVDGGSRRSKEFTLRLEYTEEPIKGYD